MLKNSLFCIAFCYLTRIVYSVELTFELADNAKECFYEEIKSNQTVTLEFQVNSLDDMMTLIYEFSQMNEITVV